MAYDQRCYDLAAVFLGDESHVHTPNRIGKLAQVIQTTIDDWISSEAAMFEEVAETCPYTEAEIERSQARIADVLGIKKGGLCGND